MKLVFILSLTITLSSSLTEIRSQHPDVGLNAKQLIGKYGYPLEIHTVLTTDDYLLEVHRIPYEKNNTSKGRQKIPIVIVPGLLGSSADFVNMGPENSLGFFLVDKGFDVWLLNYRGTTWSRQHLTLDPDVDKKQYWTFSFHEIGLYDTRECIDYILSVTGQDSLHYIGYSQGTTSFLAFASEHAEYSKRIRSASLLTPVAYANNIRSPIIKLLARKHTEIKEFTEKYELYEVLPHYDFFTYVGQLFCNDEAPTQYMCAWFLYIIAGFSPIQLNKSRIPIVTSNSPAGSSIYQSLHYSQLVETGLFQKYDYGEEENKIKYGQSKPPQYNLTRVTSPIALFYGNRDLLCAEKDVKRLAAELPNVQLSKRIRGFNHLDFVWGKDAKKKVFNDIVNFIEKH